MTTFLDSLQESVAVIGMRGRFPGAPSIEHLWQNLTHGVESIRAFSEEELVNSGVDLTLQGVPGFVNRGCVIDSIDLFDAGFFGYSARDAETIDPQQRIFLETAWESLESAGYNPETAPPVGVFVGSDQSTYVYQIISNIDPSAFGYAGMMSIGNEKDYVATQVSYKLNLHGPSMAVQTSCSTSLVAVTMACQSLLFGSCDLALAGGVAIAVPQHTGYWYQPGGILSPDGHCRPFDVAGQGTVVGSGVGIVVLKRLSDAIADGDRIHAVIKGFGLNNDGSGKVGYTAPSIEGQAAAIRMAQRMARVEPDTIGYIETHGTATNLGDPVEFGALTKAFRERTDAKQFCAIGSLKSNVGHLSSAAGVSGLIKGILTVQHGLIPKSLHFESPNPHIDFKNSPFFVASQNLPWPITEGPRRAGVSSFGVGGTNAHVVLEQAPQTERDERAPETQLLVLSARTPNQLEKMTDNLIAHLESEPDADLADVAYTLQVGRKVFSNRRAVVFRRSNREGLLDALRARDPKRVHTIQSEIRDRAVVFLFSGQGTQYVNMGRELYESEPSFRDDVDACAETLRKEMSADIREFMYPDEAHRERAQTRLTQTSITQPALFTLEYSLARLWMRLGLVPRAMVGHSIGEYVAACIAGVMELSDALSVVAMRGKLMESMPAGSMLAVSLPEAALQPLLGPHLSLAAVNAPALCVLSGATAAIDTLERQFTDKQMMCRRLQTSHAFHSSMMNPILRQFVDHMSRVKLRPPKIAYLSNVTGSWITPELAMSAQYWGTHLRQTVRFADNMREVMAFPDLALLEVGPGQTLGFLARQQGGRANSQLILQSIRSAQEDVRDSELLRATLGQLWMGGAKIDWSGLHADESRCRVPLPTYPFDRQRFWLGKPIAAVATGGTAPVPTIPVVDVSLPVASAVVPAAAARVGKSDLADWFFVPSWQPAVSSADIPALNSGAWLIFRDSTGLGDDIARRLRDAGTTVTVVDAGDGFITRENGFSIRPSERVDYEEMIQTLRESNRLPSRILQLWCVSEPPLDLGPQEAFDDAQRRGFHSLVLLAQAIGKKAGSAPVEIGVVTDCLQALDADEPVRANEGTVLGITKVIAQEYPNIRCRAIDVVRSHANLDELLVKELAHEPFAPEVAWRNGRRWTLRHEPLRLEQPADKSPLLNDGGVYLITGGLGKIGLIMAEAIAKQVKAKLVLCSRSAINASTSQRQKVQELETLGAEVHLVQGDATDGESMERVVTEVRNKWGRIDGVVHAAANLAQDTFAPLRDLDVKKADACFATKAKGLLILEQLLHDEPPAFYVLLSSLSAVLGGLNLGAYAASNAFLDSQARRGSRADGTVWITLNWDAWDFVGDGAEAILPHEGAEAFARILATGQRRVVVSVSPLAARVEKWVINAGRVAPVAEPAPGAAAGTIAVTHSRPDLSTQYVAPRNPMETTIAEQWEQLLGVKPIGVHDRFFELGGHSLLAIQLLARLRELFDLDLPVQRIFEAPTVGELSASIERDRAAAAREPADQAEDNTELQEMLDLVDGLSEVELDALLAEARSMQNRSEAHG